MSALVCGERAPGIFSTKNRDDFGEKSTRCMLFPFFDRVSACTCSVFRHFGGVEHTSAWFFAKKGRKFRREGAGAYFCWVFRHVHLFSPPFLLPSLWAWGSVPRLYARPVHPACGLLCLRFWLNDQVLLVLLVEFPENVHKNRMRPPHPITG